MATSITTKAQKDGGRSVAVKERNKAAVAVWLGDALISWDSTKNGPKFKLKTPKGPRVAVEGDVIVKYGTRRNGGEVTFQVLKG